jgi:hypothetical protein
MVQKNGAAQVRDVKQGGVLIALFCTECPGAIPSPAGTTASRP